MFVHTHKEIIQNIHVSLETRNEMLEISKLER